MTAVASSPKTTLVILLGASNWPFSPEFQPSQAFLNSAIEVRNYFLNPNQFGLPYENLLNLFNSDQSADDIDGEIGHFIARRMLAMKQAGEAARDLVVYFIGHGGFVGNDSDYYLAIRRTRTDNPSVSGIRMVSLAYTLREKARYLRRIVILDCCFAGAAFLAFQSGPAQTAIIQAVDAFKVQGKGMGVPERGTSLLCSSGHKAPSLISQDGMHTIFSKALLRALSTGNPRQQDNLSLRDIAGLTEDALHAMPEKSAPRPEVHSPDQVDGNVAEVPLFPNLAAGAIKASQHIVAPPITGKPPQGNLLPSLVLPVPAVRPRSSPPKISRRAAIVGLAAVGVTIAGGGLVWWVSIPQPLYTYHGHSQGVYAVARSPSGKRIASGSEDKTVQVWDATDGGNVFPYRGHSGTVAAVAWSPDGTRIASGSWDNTVQVWGAADGRNAYIYRKHTGPIVVGGVAWSPNAMRILSGDEYGQVQVWDAANGENGYTYPGHAGKTVAAVAWSPDGKRIASAGNDGIVQVWDAADGGNVFLYRGHAADSVRTGGVYAVAWSPDSKRIASAGGGKVQVWDAVDGGNVFTFSPNSDVGALAWSPNGNRIASGSLDAITVQVWDAVDGSHTSTYGGNFNQTGPAVIWFPDGTRLVSGDSRDGTVKIWAV